MALHLPLLPRGTGTHRSPAPTQLRTEVARLAAFKTAADAYFHQLATDRDQVHHLWQQEREYRLGLEAQVQELQRELDAARAHLANAHSISTLPQLVDTEPQGIDCRALQRQYTAKPAIPLWNRPLTGST